MFEMIGCVRRFAAAENEPRTDEPLDPGVELGIVATMRQLQQLVGKAAADDGADLGELPGGAETVEPRLQRALQGRRDQCRRTRTGGPRADRPALENHPHQLFQKERYAVAAREDVAFCLRWHRRLTGDPDDQCLRVLLRQLVDRQPVDLCVVRPMRRELATGGDDEQDPEVRDPLDRQRQQFECGRVEPLRILDDHERRVPRRQLFEHPQQHREYPVLASLRAQLAQPRLVCRQR
jgi:hypothetical protein